MGIIRSDPRVNASLSSMPPVAVGPENKVGVIDRKQTWFVVSRGRGVSQHGPRSESHSHSFLYCRRSSPVIHGIPTHSRQTVSGISETSWKKHTVVRLVVSWNDLFWLHERSIAQQNNAMPLSRWCIGLPCMWHYSASCATRAFIFKPFNDSCQRNITQLTRCLSSPCQ